MKVASDYSIRTVLQHLHNTLTTVLTVSTDMITEDISEYHWVISIRSAVGKAIPTYTLVVAQQRIEKCLHWLLSLHVLAFWSFCSV